MCCIQQFQVENLATANESSAKYENGLAILKIQHASVCSPDGDRVTSRQCIAYLWVIRYFRAKITSHSLMWTKVMCH